MAAKVAPSYPVSFVLAVNRTLWWETGGAKDGGLTNDPDDPGGITKWGISQIHNPDIDVAKLTRGQAVELYYKRYWKPYELDELTDAVVCVTVFDCMVNPGPKSGTRCIQSACATLGQSLIVDSKLGPKTRAAINALSHTMRPDLLAHIAGQLYAFYWERAVAYPERKKYMKGWTRRAFQNMALIAPDGEQLHRYMKEVL